MQAGTTAEYQGFATASVMYVPSLHAALAQPENAAQGLKVSDALEADAFDWLVSG